jgi:predicted Fe-Mo cluster-binding NifX family protein
MNCYKFYNGTVDAAQLQIGRESMHVVVCARNGRIAPKYYDAAQLLSLIVENGAILNREVIALEALNPDELCSLVLHMNADVIICGGIRKDYQDKLNRSSVQLIYNVIGNVDDVLKRFMEGNLSSGDIVN